MHVSPPSLSVARLLSADFEALILVIFDSASKVNPPLGPSVGVTGAGGASVPYNGVHFSGCHESIRIR